MREDEKKLCVIQRMRDGKVIGYAKITEDQADSFNSLFRKYGFHFGFIVNQIQKDTKSSKSSGGEYMKINDMICELLEEVETRNGNVVFNERSKELIHEIAAKCSDLQIVKETQDQAEKYAEDLTAEEVFKDMLNKIVKAHNRIYAVMSAKMLIPVIDRKIRRFSAVTS